MSPMKKPTEPRSLRKSHVLRHHGSKAASSASPRPHAHPLVRDILALEALGWRLVELRPAISGGEPTLWHVTITRVDLDARMTAKAAEPDVALAELVRYASADGAAAR